MTKNYVKKHKGHKVPALAAHYNYDNHCFYNKDKTEFRSTIIPGVQWAAVSNPRIANEAIELPEQDLPNWDDAPEWADRLMTCRFVDYWCSAERYTEVGLNTDSALFKAGGVTIGDLTLIEMRPIAIEDKEWLPVVGEECQCLLIDDELGESVFVDVKLLYQFDNGEYAVVRLDTCALEYSSEFRPLKTANELKREAFIEACYSNSKAASNDYMLHIFEDLYKAGFTAPKEGGDV